jgi:hypothetical protein
LSKNILRFKVSCEGWYSTLSIPYGFDLTLAGTSFSGSGLFIFDGQWVCDPDRPKERFALVRREPRDMVDWFDQHPYLMTSKLPDWVDAPNGLHGKQFEVETNPHTPDTDIAPGLENPRVPVFPAYPRSHIYAVVKGKKNRVISLEHGGDPLIIVVEAPPDEFNQFNERVEREVLPNVYWGRT